MSSGQVESKPEVRRRERDINPEANVGLN